jgi:hypothetical protein
MVEFVDNLIEDSPTPSRQTAGASVDVIPKPGQNRRGAERVSASSSTRAEIDHCLLALILTMVDTVDRSAISETMSNSNRRPFPKTPLLLQMR